MLDAAEALVREQGSVDFAMRELALRADVSPATPFKHFGSKRGVLRALPYRHVAQTLDQKPLSKNNDAIDELFDDVGRATDYFASDAKLYRPLLGAIIADMAPTKLTLLEQSIDLTNRSLRKAQRLGQLPRNVDIRLLAEQIEGIYVGAIYFWASGLIDGENWKLRIEHGLALLLSGIVASEVQKPLLKRARRCAKLISAEGPLRVPEQQ